MTAHRFPIGTVFVETGGKQQIKILRHEPDGLFSVCLPHVHADGQIALGSLATFVVADEDLANPTLWRVVHRPLEF